MMLRHAYHPKFGQEDAPQQSHAQPSFIILEHSENLPGDEYSQLVVPFKRFGPGEKPRDYEVEINWLDVKNLINKFVEIGHPHALYLKRTLELARAVERTGWHNDDEPVEFWEDLLPPER